LRRTCLVIASSIVLLVACASPPRSYWVQGSRPVESLDTGPWDALLRAHVLEGVVDYPAFAASADFAAFRRALRKARFTRDTSFEQRLAFWLNAYNAATIAGILDAGSPEGRRERTRFFERTYHAVGGEEITLSDLEHARLRMLGEPRIHFAIACPFASCPQLASEAFDPGRLDEQLERSAHNFVNDATRNRFDAVQGVARLSRVFERNREDFEAAEGTIARYVARYVEDPQAAAALRDARWKIEYLPDDWSVIRPPFPVR